jgi:hypothetical protein
VSRRILAVLIGVLVVFVCGGWGQIKDADGHSNAVVTPAVQALTSDSELVLPHGFEAARGYRPEVVRLPSGTLVPVAPEGGCSSPIGGSEFNFTDACREHDLGYDLLRYAAADGESLGPWARQAVDAEFARQLRSQCHGLGCRAMAEVYIGVVRFNSWRQGYGVPRAETPWQLFGPVVAGLLVGGGLLAALRPRRKRERERRPAERLVPAGAR